MKHLGIVLVAVFLVLTAGAAPAAAEPLSAGACGPVYIVRYGDTLYRIAVRCGTTISAIMARNPTVVNPNRIFAGQRLVMPGSSPQPPTFTRVQIPLIALGGENAPQGPVGCGDSIVMVTRNVPATTAPLTAAVKQLLSLHDRIYGQSGLYNPLYQSSLSVQSVTITNGLAVIRLTGRLSLGGECDDPRVAAMFDSIGRQYSTVKRVQVYVNGTPLESLLGGKGS